MASALLPLHEDTPLGSSSPVADGLGGDSSTSGASGGSGGSAGSGGSGYVIRFQEEVLLVHSSGMRHRVRYEGTAYNRQKHYRLTIGWTKFVQAHGVDVGACRGSAGEGGGAYMHAATSLLRVTCLQPAATRAACSMLGQ
jgi:hypothetical protein